MSNPNLKLIPAYIFIFTLLVMIISACAFPFPTSQTSTAVAPDETTSVQPPQAASEEPPRPPEETREFPGKILTEVAGTLYAQITTEADTIATSSKPTATHSKPTETPTTPTNTQTSTRTPGVIATELSTFPTAKPPIPITPYVYLTPWALRSSAWSTAYFQIKNLNLHECGPNYAANFRVYNTSNDALESLLIEFTDETTNTVLLGAVTNNSPFLSTDRTCNNHGSDSLAPNYLSYFGDTLGPKTLSEHTISARIRLCTQENLAGTCSEIELEFVVP